MFARNFVFIIALSLWQTLFCFDFNTVSIPTQNNAQTFPQDISFCIIDLKYKKPELKICEFGQGMVSGFQGHQRLYGYNMLWFSIWNFLASFNMPLTFVGKLCKFADACNGTQPPLRCKNLYSKYSRLESFFFRPTEKPQTPFITFSNQPALIFDEYKKIKNIYPQTIVLDDATRPFVLNKVFTHLLFSQDPELAWYRPGCHILPTIYTKNLAQEIVSQIPADAYVIKPINAFKGAGIVMVRKEDLDPTLRKLFDKKRDLSVNTSYKYWKKYTHSHFLIETLEHSQPISVDKKEYDATMRIAFGISYKDGVVAINFFSAYWKLPPKALHAAGSLSERHQSHISKDSICSAKVAPETYKEVTALLSKILPKIYLKMIALRHNPAFMETLYEACNIQSKSITYPCNDFIAGRSSLILSPVEGPHPP